MISGQDFTILGAGIGGLTAAVALAQRGAKVTVLEQAPAITEVGAGLQISPNGFRVLQALGLGDTARMHAMAGRGVWLRDGVSGHEVLDFSFNKVAPDATFLLFHRADLIDLLAQAARAAGVDIRCGVTVEEITPSATTALVKIAGEPAQEMGFVVGADGLHSVAGVCAEWGACAVSSPGRWRGGLQSQPPGVNLSRRRCSWAPDATWSPIHCARVRSSILSR